LAHKVHLQHLLALWPAAPQKRQRLLLKCCWHSSGVSFPSAPSLPHRWGFLASPESLELLEFPVGLDPEVPEFEPEFAGCLSNGLLDLVAPGGWRTWNYPKSPFYCCWVS